MSPALQTALSLLAVALAATWLIRRILRKKNSGCGGECGCPSVGPEIKRLQARAKK